MRPVIMCIDDEQFVLTTIKKQLKFHLKDEYIIEISESGTEALEILDGFIKQSIDVPVVICDQIMPYLKGDDVLEKVHAVLPDTLTILLTGQASVDDLGNAVNKAKLYRYISKPWEEMDLCLTVKEAVRSYDQQKKIKKIHQELTEAHSQLVQTAKLACIGELAAGVAHELNQPLMVIRTGVQLMMRSYKHNTLKLDQLEHQFDTIEKNTKRMMNIINHLRTFSRQSELQPIEMNICDVIENTFLMIGEQLRLRNIEVIRTVTNSLPKIKGNPTQLEQVFLNLLANSRDAIEEKGKSIGGKIEITIGSEDNFVEILIKDSGVGIASHHLEKIYDPFYTTKEVGKGTGLGLSISFGIIKDHHGDIEVIQTDSSGTTFRVRLPV
ncbi:MAG: response regulator [Desulfobacterales bacterium]|nr:response regulator [Desulfobacterales bacterium]